LFLKIWRVKAGSYYVQEEHDAISEFIQKEQEPWKGIMGMEFYLSIRKNDTMWF
jgi:hypothetical protein